MEYNEFKKMMKDIRESIDIYKAQTKAMHVVGFATYGIACAHGFIGNKQMERLVNNTVKSLLRLE